MTKQDMSRHQRFQVSYKVGSGGWHFVALHHNLSPTDFAVFPKLKGNLFAVGNLMILLNATVPFMLLLWLQTGLETDSCARNTLWHIKNVLIYIKNTLKSTNITSWLLLKSAMDLTVYMFISFSSKWFSFWFYTILAEILQYTTRTVCMFLRTSNFFFFINQVCPVLLPLPHSFSDPSFSHWNLITMQILGSQKSSYSLLDQACHLPPVLLQGISRLSWEGTLPQTSSSTLTSFSTAASNDKYTEG